MQELTDYTIRLNKSQRRGEIKTAWFRIGMCAIFALLLVLIINSKTFTNQTGMNITLVLDLVAPLFSFVVIYLCRAENSYKWLRWVTATLDITLISGILLGFSLTGALHISIIGIYPHIYYVFIGVAGLRNYSPVVLYAGILVSLQYLGFVIAIFYYNLCVDYVPVRPELTKVPSIYISSSNTATVFITPSVWTAGKGTGNRITPALSTNRYSGEFGLEFKYTLIAGGYVGVIKSMNGANWSEKNALQLWTIPDGKRQKVVLQVTSGNNVFEVYLNEYEQYNNAVHPLLVTIPFSSFTGRDDKAAVFDASDIQSFGLWCNIIGPEGEDAGSYTLDSVLYYDEIKTVNSAATAVSFVELIPNRSPILAPIGNKTLAEGEILEFTFPPVIPMVISCS